MHHGEDTVYYLKMGYRVVAIDADPKLIDRARACFADAVNAKRLTLEWCAIGPGEGEIDFFRSEQTLWNSVHKNVSTRDKLNSETVRVRIKQLAQLFHEYGTPTYCKIDIEGMDAMCLRTLNAASELSAYMSVESECLGDEGDSPESDPLETLRELVRLEFTRFKLVDQRSLIVLPPTTSLYRLRPTLWERAARRMGGRGYSYYCYWDAVEENRRRLAASHNYDFPHGSSGPFGSDLDGTWLDAETAERALMKHRRDYFRMPGSAHYGFWCDWHAAR
jgi:FkbM family methyltransferase